MSKLRKTKGKGGKEGKAITRLNGRLAAWEATVNKGPDWKKAFRKPGAPR